LEKVRESALKDKETVRLEQEIFRLLTVNEKLKNEILYLRRILFGRSSERYVKEDPNQLRLDFGGEDSLPEEAQTALEGAKETITCERKKKKENSGRPVRQPLPAEPERREEIIEPDPIPEGSKYIGEEVSEILEYTPGKIHVRRKYALPEEADVVIGGLPSLPLQKSNAGASLLSHLLVSKYQDHIPFYRQMEIFKRQGVTLSPATVNGWFSAATDLPEPLYDVLKKEVTASDYIRIDETTIPVMDRIIREQQKKATTGSSGRRKYENSTSITTGVRGRNG
jgi:transposase